MRTAAGQAELGLGIAEWSASAPFPITSSRSAHLWDALPRAYDVLGFDCGLLVLARIIEPTSKADSLQVLDEIRRIRR